MIHPPRLRGSCRNGLGTNSLAASVARPTPVVPVASESGSTAWCRARPLLGCRFVATGDVNGDGQIDIVGRATDGNGRTDMVGRVRSKVVSWFRVRTAWRLESLN